MRTIDALTFSLLFCTLAACGDRQGTALLPPDTKLGRDETGYFCGMIVVDHSGPKSQIRLRGAQPRTLWFTSVRDGIAYTMLPEETQPVAGFYVTLVSSANWDHPEQDPDNWVAADAAWYVIGSERRGSMGAAEAFPFADKTTAEAFSAEFGGRVVRLADIPGDYILGPETPAPP